MSIWEWQQAKQDALRAKLEAEHGISPNHPKAELLFRLAWEWGHENPEESPCTERCYAELVELVK